MMKILSLRDIIIFYFGISTCLIFFNPLGLTNEIFPYFLFSILFLKASYLSILFSIIILIFGMIWFQVIPFSRSLLDALILSVMLLGTGIFHSLNEQEKLSVLKIFKNFIFFTLFICIFQTLFEPIQAATYDFYTSRSSEAGLEALIGRGVTGLAPEPAYGAAHIIGLSMLMATFQKPSFNVIISVLLILLLMRSVSGFLYGILYFGFITLVYFKFSLKNSLIVFGISILLIIAFVFKFDINEFLLIFKRLFEFAIYIFEYRDIVLAEDEFGSSRLVAVFSSFSEIFFFDYSSAFSPLSVVIRIFATPLVYIVILGYLLIVNKFYLSYLIPIVFLTVAGPTMLWPLFYTGIYGINYNNDEVKP